MSQEDVMKMLETSPAVMQDWVLHTAADKEITGLELRAEPDAFGWAWARWKYSGSHRTVTVHCGKEVYEQTFIKRDNEWSEVKEST